MTADHSNTTFSHLNFTFTSLRTTVAANFITRKFVDGYSEVAPE